MKRLIYAFVILHLSSCNPMLCSWNRGYNQLDKIPERKDIVGFYQLNNESKEFLNETYTEWALKLELNNDGYYNLINSNRIPIV